MNQEVASVTTRASVCALDLRAAASLFPAHCQVLDTRGSILENLIPEGGTTLGSEG